MDGPVPCHRLEEPIEPFHLEPGGGPRACPRGLMLRPDRVQSFYNLRDPGMEGPLDDAESERRLVGLRRSGARRYETTLLSFRHLWVWGDAGYQGSGKREETGDAEVDGQLAMKAGTLRPPDEAGAQEAAERRTASVRAPVEHPFLHVKRHVVYAKVFVRHGFSRLRGLVRRPSGD